MRASIECIRLLLMAALLAFMLIASASAAEPKESPSEEPGWKAGVATAKITPKQPMWMAGYAARKKPSQGTTQDLFAKALALEDGHGRRAVIVTMDLIGVLVSLSDAVEKRVQEQHELPPEALLLAASHTHCGPEYRERKGREEEARNYHQFLEDTLVKLVGDSLADLAPAKLTYNHARAGFAMNRRRDYQLPEDDVNHGKRNNPDGPVDHDVPVLCVRDAEGRERVVLFGYACHNTTLSFCEFCGDYAGYAQEYLQADHPGLTALFVAGCGADQNPYPRSTVELAKRHGRSLATGVEAALFANPRPLGGSLRCTMEKIDLPRADEEAEKRVYPIQVIRLGDDVTLVALASEVVVDYSLRLKRELGRPPAMLWVAAYCNGYFGYIPSARVLAEGGYEAPAYSPTIEEQIVGKVHEMVRDLERPAEAD
jgi:neutral ceramidase